MTPTAILHEPPRVGERGEALDVFSFDGGYAEMPAQSAAAAGAHVLTARADGPDGEIGFDIAFLHAAEDAGALKEDGWSWGAHGVELRSRGAASDRFVRFLAERWGLPAPRAAAARVALQSELMRADFDTQGGLDAEQPPLALNASGSLFFDDAPGDDRAGMILDLRSPPWMIGARRVELRLIEEDARHRRVILQRLSAASDMEAEDD